MSASPRGVPRDVEGLARTLGRKVDSTIRLDTAGLEAIGVPSAALARLPRLEVGDGEGVDLRVSEVLGAGGMGQVRLARQVALDRDVAVKSVLASTDDPASSRLLLREGLITGRLEHPNIVPVHLLGVDERGSPVLVLKRVEGVPWSALEPARPPAPAPEEDAWRGDAEPLLRHLEVFREVCRAVELAHSRGYVHRDIKPSNVMIGPFGEVYLLDWGIATAIGTTAYAHAKGDEPALPLGTPQFMAPEMIDTDGVIDERTDVYLLGATLHRVLTGTPRHAGDDILEVLSAAVRSEPVPYLGAVPEELAKILNRATAASAEDRFPTVAEMREAVTNYLRHKSSIDLTGEADRLLASLHAPAPHPDEARAQQNRVFAECRFAYRRALREWGDNARARRGLGRCLAAMIERDLAAGEIESAQAHLDELPEPDPELANAVREARARLAEDRARIAGLRALAFQMDVRVGWAARGVLVAVLALLVLLTALTTTLDASPFPETPMGALRVMAPFFVAFGVALSLGRRWLLQNDANRRLMALVGVALVGMTVHRGLGVLTDASFGPLLADDAWLAAIVAACGAVTIDRSLWAPAAVWAAGAAALPFAGEHVLPWYSGTQLVGLVVLIVGWSRRGPVARRPSR